MSGTGDMLPSRAHRRFLRLLAPTRSVSEQTEPYVPLVGIVLDRSLRSVLEMHLATAGQLRSGILLGSRQAETLLVRILLPAGYPPFLAKLHAFDMDARYVLGAVDALRLTSVGSWDWVGQWVMPADGLVPGDAWVQWACRMSMSRALMDVDTPLLIFGRSSERVEVQAWAADPEGARNDCRELTVTWMGSLGIGE